MMNELSTERAIEALYTVRAYYASLTAGYPKGKDRRGIGDVMCSEIANSCLMAIKALEQKPSEGVEVIRVGKNTIKARQGRFIVYDVEWLKEHCNTTEKMLYGLPSEDCTSKELVIEWLKDKDIIKTKNQEENARRELAELPSVTPSYNSIKTELEQTRWIPVSERLPKAFEFVNCTCHSLIDDREDWFIETVYVPQPSDSPYSDWGNIPMLNSGDCKVVAWVHRDIPEPYKTEIEDEE